ncbi:MAG: hypothetical protein ABI346_00010 [Candidatus Baltobacteraceae bacterium]
MGGFREHLIDRYFGFRERYVAAVAERAPASLRMAIVAEIARLGFLLAGCGLICAVFAVLAWGALQREGVTLWPSVFVLCALVAGLASSLSVRGLAVAARRLRALREGGS